MKRLLLLICFVGFAIISQAQKAKITGKITSVKNDALIGVSLTLKSDKTQVSKTDVEGRYSFNIDVNKKYSVALSYVGYKAKTIENINLFEIILNKEITNRNYISNEHIFPTFFGVIFLTFKTIFFGYCHITTRCFVHVVRSTYDSHGHIINSNPYENYSIFSFFSFVSFLHFKHKITPLSRV